MWFAKFFGGRTVEADDEPARFAPPESAKISQPVRRVQGDVSNSTAKPTRTAAKKAGAKGGFDPYNSGAFDRSGAWERIIRR